MIDYDNMKDTIVNNQLLEELMNNDTTENQMRKTIVTAIEMYATHYAETPNNPERLYPHLNGFKRTALTYYFSKLCEMRDDCKKYDELSNEIDEADKLLDDSIYMEDGDEC